MVHHGNTLGYGLGAVDIATLGVEKPTTLTTRQVRMQILNSLPTVPEGTPTPFGEVTPAAIIAMNLYGERSPGLPEDVHPAIYQHCA